MGSTGSIQVPWVQPRHWFHRIPDSFFGVKHAMVPQVPDRFLGFNRGTVGIVEGVNVGNCPNYVLLNAPLRRTIFGVGGDAFLTGMPFTNRNHATGFNHATGSTASRQVPWVQGSTRHWFHRFQAGSLGSTTRWFNRGTVGIVEGVNFGNCPNYVLLNAPLRRTIFGMGGDAFLTGMPFANINHATASTGSRQVPWVQPRHWFHSFQAGSLGSRFNTDRFLGFNRGTVGIVEGVNFGKCPNYVLLNAPLCRTIFGMGGDAFLTGMPFTKRNHATGSTGSRKVPWVQPRHWFHSFQTGSLGSNTQWFHRFHRFHTGSLGSTRHWFHRFHTGSLGLTTLWVQQVPYRCLGFSHATGSTGFQTGSLGWNTHWFHRFQTGSLGSTVELWELWRVWISAIVQTTFCLMHHCAAPFLEWAGMRFWQECLSRIETSHCTSWRHVVQPTATPQLHTICIYLLGFQL